MEKFIKPITKNCTKIIFDQMNNFFYKINYNNGNFTF